jgi:hypothetical protein
MLAISYDTYLSSPVTPHLFLVQLQPLKFKVSGRALSALQQAKLKIIQTRFPHIRFTEPRGIESGSSIVYLNLKNRNYRRPAAVSSLIPCQSLISWLATSVRSRQHSPVPFSSRNPHLLWRFIQLHFRQNCSTRV